mmetsp:Transcript_42755/g.68635  ORF Transcript_42755/g.68635 Transcript_42755/m.68635 type:complete len:281 (+) Transcript_42755:44-886(+)
MPSPRLFAVIVAQHIVHSSVRLLIRLWLLQHQLKLQRFLILFTLHTKLHSVIQHRLIHILIDMIQNPIMPLILAMIAVFVHLNQLRIAIIQQHQQRYLAVIQYLLRYMSFMPVPSAIPDGALIPRLSEPKALTVVHNMKLVISFVVRSILGILQKAPIHIIHVFHRRASSRIANHAEQILVLQVEIRARNHIRVHLGEDRRLRLILKCQRRILHPFRTHLLPVVFVHDVRRTHTVYFPRFAVSWMARCEVIAESLPFHPFRANAVFLRHRMSFADPQIAW